jgi:hypothetical protein
MDAKIPSDSFHASVPRKYFSAPPPPPRQCFYTPFTIIALLCSHSVPRNKDQQQLRSRNLFSGYNTDRVLDTTSAKPSSQ